MRYMYNSYEIFYDMTRKGDFKSGDCLIEVNQVAA
jgi:hypothetical protein